MSTEEKKSSVSFGFSRTNETRKLQSSSLRGDDDSDKKEEKDYVISVEDKAISGTREVPKEKELIIPLINTNRWRSAIKPEELEKQTDSTEDATKATQSTNQIKTGDAVVDQAVSEILQDVHKHGSATTESTLSIPLLMKNKIPDGFETDDRLDVSLRPDEASDADYDAVPITQFGLAMLRGMGWKEGAGVGKNKQTIKPIEANLRPKGLGLGADRSLEAQKKQGTSDTAKDERGETLVMKKGTHCVVLSGKREGQYGTIVGLDEDNSRAMVLMALGSETISLSQLCIKLVSKKEYDKCHKYLNKLKADRYQEEEGSMNGHNGSKKVHSIDSDSEDSRHKSRKRDERSDDESKTSRKEQDSRRKRERRSESREGESNSNHRRSDRGRMEEKDRGSEGGRHRHKKHKRDRSSSRDNSNGTSNPKLPVWLQPNLRVRIIDERYKNGKYFKEKVIIEDVITPETCICRTSEGRVLEGIHQSQLETVIPRDGRSFVMLVFGKHKSQLGELLSRDKTNSSALVQLLRDRDVVVTASYEQMCEYTGDIDAQFDY